MARSTYDDFLIKDKIGSGSYGVVYKVIRKVDRCGDMDLPSPGAIRASLHGHGTSYEMLAPCMPFTSNGVVVQAGLRHEGNRSTRDDTEGERQGTPAALQQPILTCYHFRTMFDSVHASDLPVA